MRGWGCGPDVIVVGFCGRWFSGEDTTCTDGSDDFHYLFHFKRRSSAMRGINRID